MYVKNCVLIKSVCILSAMYTDTDKRKSQRFEKKLASATGGARGGLDAKQPVLVPAKSKHYREMLLRYAQGPSLLQPVAFYMDDPT